MEKMIGVKCRSLFKGNASIGSHIVDQAREEKIPIQIRYKGQIMTISPYGLSRFFTFGKGREYPHKDGRPGFYRLMYIRWQPDKQGEENGAAC